MHNWKYIDRTTCHYRERMLSRALKPDVEAYLRKWGTETTEAGATHVTLVRHELPPEERDTELAIRATNWIIIVADGARVTCYRRINAWRYIRRKNDMRKRRRRRHKRARRT